MKAVILANGDYPVHETALRLLEEAEMVVCCDGAANEYIRRGGKPVAIVGDGDSLAPEYRALLHQVSEQDTNDLTKAMRYLQAKTVSEVIILGATGKREDHTLGNISLLIDYFKQGVKVRMYTDYGIFIPCKNRTVFSTEKGQQVSIFNFGAVNMHSEGLQYPLFDIGNWWQGTLNEALSGTFTIDAEGYYLVYLAYK